MLEKTELSQSVKMLEQAARELKGITPEAAAAAYDLIKQLNDDLQELRKERQQVIRTR